MESALVQRIPVLLVSVLALAVIAPSASGATCRGADAMPGRASIRTLDTATLCLMNAERRARGLRPLRADRALRRAARGHANTMVRRHFFDHVSPSGSTMMARVRAASYLRHAGAYSVGENIAWGGGSLGTPRAIVRAWMKSPGHRANLLHPRFRDVGVGIAAGVPPGGMEGGTYVTDFGAKH